MSAARNRQGSCPTKQQELLLRAALLREEEAIPAWEEWMTIVNLDEIDEGSYRLLPLVYHNLHAHNIDSLLMQRLKGLRRHTWYKNQMTINTMAALLRSFRDAGITTLILKGAALVLLYYEDYGLRPMNDFDILVPAEEARNAVSVLRELNWTPRALSFKELTERCLLFKHAQPFDDASGREFDLHWHVLFTCLESTADEDFWNAAIPISVEDVPTFALCATDQLLHVCAHGAWWDPVPPVRWVADAMVILNATPDIDWDRLIEQARRCRLLLPIKETLGYLHDGLGASIPSAVLQSLRSMPVSNAEQLEYKVRTCPNDLRGPIMELWLQYMQYSRSLGGASLLRRASGFPRFLQFSWGIKHLWQVPFYIVAKGMRRIWKIAAWYKSQRVPMLSQK
jgi:hypothetical protein